MMANWLLRRKLQEPTGPTYEHLGVDTCPRCGTYRNLWHASDRPDKDKLCGPCVTSWARCDQELRSRFDRHGKVYRLRKQIAALMSSKP